MLIDWVRKAQQDYKSFKNDQSTLDKINKLLESIEKQYDDGIGVPERLKGFQERLVYSRRIDKKNRLIYEAIRDDNNRVTSVTILAVKGHYNDK